MRIKGHADKNRLFQRSRHPDSEDVEEPVSHLDLSGPS